VIARIGDENPRIGVPDVNRESSWFTETADSSADSPDRTQQLSIAAEALQSAPGLVDNHETTVSDNIDVKGCIELALCSAWPSDGLKMIPFETESEDTVMATIDNKYRTVMVHCKTFRAQELSRSISTLTPHGEQVAEAVKSEYPVEFAIGSDQDRAVLCDIDSTYQFQPNIFTETRISAPSRLNSMILM
jgi:hypothetical protein